MSEPVSRSLRGSVLAGAPLALGLFSMAAQALLFRVHLTAFGGHELGFGVFLASWLAWVGVGAALARLSPAAVARVAARFPLAIALVPLPALLQVVLLSRLRDLAGVPAFALVPVDALSLVTLLANAPLSLATGFLFPVACRVAGDAWGDGALRRVFALEAAGGMLGGAGVTLALVAGVAPASVFLGASLVTTVPLALAGLASRRWAAALPLGLGLVALATGAGGALGRLEVEARWSRLLPGAKMQRVVFGREGEVLEGSRGDQRLVVRQGRLAAAFPDAEAHGRVAALLVAEHPRATRFLLVGEQAPGVALALLALPDLREVAVAEPDADYLAACWRAAGRGPGEDRRLRVIGGDLRAELARGGASFDVAAVLAGDPTSLVANRFTTAEFLGVVRAALAPGGVVALRFGGGENFVSDEGAGLGRSLLATCRAAFARFVLVPGDDAWILASNGDGLTESPGVLAERLARRPGASGLHPPLAVGALFLPDRVRQAHRLYEAEGLAVSPLPNRDDRPVAHLASLVRLGRRSGLSLGGAVAVLATGGTLLALAAVGLFVLVAVVALAASPASARRRRWVSAALAGLAGFAGLGTSLALLDAFQVRYGTVYLHVGLLTAAYMGGLALGGALGRALAASDRVARRLAGPLALIAAVAAARWLGAEAPAWLLTVLLAAAGVASGLVFPLAGRLAADSEISPDVGAARVEAWDHLGAALGGLVLAFWWIPVLGLARSLELMIGLAAIVALASVVDLLPARGKDGGRARIPAVGWAALYLVLLLGVARALQAAADEAAAPALPAAVVLTLAGDDRPECPSGRGWCTLRDPQGRETGFLASTRALAPGVSGYGGRFNAVARLDLDGRVRRVLWVSDRETPAYRDAVVARLERWAGWSPLASGAATVEAVTGATVTSDALTAALQGTARRLFVDELGREPESDGAAAERPLQVELWAVLLSLALALGLALRPAPRVRRVVLALSALGLGLGWNVQLSIEPLAALLGGHAPSPSSGFPFVLVAGTLVLVLLVGNVYCGHACPFGALQETLHSLNPFGRRLMAADWRGARAGKYVLAFALVATFLVTGERAVLAVDPLVGVWRLDAAPTSLALAGVAVALALVFPRFFCRALCPTGAVLGLVGAWRPLARWTKPKAVARCDLGVQRAADLDCLRCDRCLAPSGSGAERPVAASTRARWAGIAALALGVVALGLVLAAGLAAGTDRASGRDYRRIDEAKVRALIEQGELSGQRALYWQPVEAPRVPPLDVLPSPK